MLLIAAWAGCAGLPRAADLDDLRVGLDAELLDLMDKHGVPGVAVAVARDGALAWSAGYGVADVARGVPVDPATTRFQAASISKTTAGWAALLAEQAGLVDLDAPVVLERWSWPDSPHDPAQVTLRRLLTHTAGTDVSGYPGWSTNPPPDLVSSLRGAVDPATRVTLAHEPGERARYSGGGLSVAQLAIEEATGVGYGAWLRAALFDPGGLEPHEVTFDVEALHDEATAAPHDAEGRRGDVLWYSELAAAGMSVTAEALLEYALWVVEPPVDIDPSPLTADQPEPGSFALAWMLDRHRGRELAGHDGANDGGFRTLMWVVPATGEAMVVLTNGEGGEPVLRAIDRAWRGTLEAP